MNGLVLAFLRRSLGSPNRQTLANFLVWPSERVICAHVALHIQAQKVEQEKQIFTDMMWKIWCMLSIQFFCIRGGCNMPFVWWLYLWSLVPVPVNFGSAWLSDLQEEWHFCSGHGTLDWLPSLTVAHPLLRFSTSWGWCCIMPH